MENISFLCLGWRYTIAELGVTQGAEGAKMEKLIPGPVCFAMALLTALLAPLDSWAETVESRLPSGLVVAAEYRPGKAGYPVVMLLHGFMQTRNSPPTNRLADALSDAGYAILVPTLSLGVSRRVKSLSCEAVHKHGMQDDVAELAHWANWLADRSRTGLVLVGHSTGSQHVLAYLSGTYHPLVRGAILTSVGPIYLDSSEYGPARAEKPGDSGKPAPLRRFTLAYCQKNYVSSVPAYLSYAEWGADRLVENLNRARIPVEVIIGGNDQVFPPEWPARLKKSRVPVGVIEGAGHFFDGEHEFDLFDRVNVILTRMRG